ncbi:unnamed protein product [Ectocarpus sp. 6 AP-2014]
MPEPRVPRFRVPAALVSPASLFLVGGIAYYFSLDKPSEDELNSNIGKEFPDVVRGRHEVDDRMKEFFKRVNNNDPREEERMRDLLNKGKGSHYSAKRRHATTKDIEEFGFISKPAGTSSSQTAPAATTTTTIAPLAENKRPPAPTNKTIAIYCGVCATAAFPQMNRVSNFSTRS